MPATVRDQFAMAALTGMLADPTNTLDAKEASEDAFNFADAMMEEKKKRGDMERGACETCGATVNLYVVEDRERFYCLEHKGA